jgi:phage tail sheath gpL-like
MATPGSPDFQWPIKPLIPFGPGFPAVDETYQTQGSYFSGGVLDVSAATFAGFATATVTIGGTTGSGPTVTVTVAGTGVLYTYVAGDTTATIAAGHIAAAINANGTVNLLVTATSSTNVITLTALTAGQLGMVSLSTTPTGGATAVASFTELDFANIVFPLSTFAFPTQYGLETFYISTPYSVDTATKNAMRAQGLIQ